MSESIVNIKERSEKGVSEEGLDVALDLPESVYNANWRDDIPEEARDERKEETSYEFFDEETSYESPQGDVGASLEKRLELFGRDRLRGIGGKTLEFVRKAA